MCHKTSAQKQRQVIKLSKAKARGAGNIGQMAQVLKACNGNVRMASAIMKRQQQAAAKRRQEAEQQRVVKLRRVMG